MTFDMVVAAKGVLEKLPPEVKDLLDFLEANHLDNCDLRDIRGYLLRGRHVTDVASMIYITATACDHVFAKQLIKMLVDDCSATNRSAGDPQWLYHYGALLGMLQLASSELNILDNPTQFHETWPSSLAMCLGQGKLFTSLPTDEAEFDSHLEGYFSDAVQKWLACPYGCWRQVKVCAEHYSSYEPTHTVGSKIFNLVFFAWVKILRPAQRAALMANSPYPIVKEPSADAK